jgi:hypothetical protein
LFVSSPCADRTPLTGSNNGGTFLAIELGNKHLQPHRLRPFRLFIRREIAGDASDRSSGADRSRQDRAASKKTVTAVLGSDQADVSVGSFASFCPPDDDFRSTPVNGRLQSPSACLKGANFGIGSVVTARRRSSAGRHRAANRALTSARWNELPRGPFLPSLYPRPGPNLDLCRPTTNRPYSLIVHQHKGAPHNGHGPPRSERRGRT